MLTIDLKQIAPPPGKGGGGSAGFDYEEDLMFSSGDISYKSSNRQLRVTVDGDGTEGFLWVDVTELGGKAGSYTVTIRDEYGSSDTETVTID